MSVQYKAVLCYGIELINERQLSYINKVGEERWEEILDNWFIRADGWGSDAFYGILGIEIASAADGEYMPLGNGNALTRSIPSDQYEQFRDAMFEIGEFSIRPELYMICQVS